MKNSVEVDQLDLNDKRILQELSKDGRIPITDLAKRLGMSKTPCAVRVRKLIEQRFILGFRAVLNQQKLDMNHVAFVELKLDDTRDKALAAFNKAVQTIPEIEQCHMIAGAFDYLLKVRTKDIDAYRKVLGEQITTLPHVANSSTHVTMETVKETDNQPVSF